MGGQWEKMKFYKDYWELREIIKTLIPRRGILDSLEKQKGLVKEKGRKVNYQEFNFEKDQYEVKQRLLNKEEITSFLEVSLRAAHCIAEGQTVHTNNGNVNIENVLIGSKVASFNKDENQIEFEEIENIFESVRDDMIEIETDTGEILVTSDHHIFTKSGWKMAKDLTEEDEILEME